MNPLKLPVLATLAFLVGCLPSASQADEAKPGLDRTREADFVYRALRGIKLGTDDQPLAEQLKRVEAQLNEFRLLAISYEILQIHQDQEVPLAIPPDRHEFSFGDKITLKLTSPVDAYLSLFYRDQQGNVACLWPQSPDNAPRVKAGEVKILPYRGLDIGPPAGDDELIVVASLEPIENLKEFAGRLEKKPGQVAQNSADPSNPRGDKPKPNQVATSPLEGKGNSTKPAPVVVNPLDQLTGRTGPEQGYRVRIDVNKNAAPTAVASSRRGLRAIYQFNRPVRGGRGLETIQIAEVDRDGDEVFPFLIRLRTKAPAK